MDDSYYTQLIISETNLEVANTEIRNLKKKIEDLNIELIYYKKILNI